MPTEKKPVELIRADHEEVKGLFKQFESARTAEKKYEIANACLMELTVHTKLEEDLFYPATREAGIEEDSLQEANEEHHVAKMLIAELSGMDGNEENFEAKFMVLVESINHHIQEEEANILKKVGTKLPEDLGEKMMKRKEELKESPPDMAQMPMATGGSRR